jgi:potassium channel LctB
VRHYPGGLAEWFGADPPDIGLDTRGRAERATTGVPARLSGLSSRRAASLLNPTSLSTRFIDALSEHSVGVLFRWWLVIVIGCGAAFWLLSLRSTVLVSSGQPVSHGLGGLATAVYFSAVTATSIGYGDIVPVGPARLLAIAEGAAGLILFGCVISKFVSRRQDQLIAEIHHIAFEDRLGRLRSNLHLIRTEVQATLRLCEGRDMPPPEAIARVESVAMIFVGELYAVHDLLYRPQQTVDEPELEAILAGLTAVFREFTELLSCVRAQRPVSSNLLRANLASMQRLAREICGDCVPREFAPSLRTWMDQIQRMAGALVQM